MKVSSPNARRRAYRENVAARESVVVLRKRWTEDECNRVGEALERALQRRGGWSALRHADFPTVDLPAFELSPRAYSWVRRAVRDRVLAPFAESNGLDVADLYFKDLFFVVYNADHPQGQTELALHKDGSLFSFNLLLNEASEFRGGGTLFPHADVGVVQINKGDAVCHDGKVEHGGAKVHSGRRLILVGFIDTVVSEEPSYGESREAQERRNAMEVRAYSERERNRGNAQYNESDMQDILLTLSGIKCDDSDEEEEEEDKPCRFENVHVVARRVLCL